MQGQPIYKPSLFLHTSSGQDEKEIKIVSFTSKEIKLIDKFSQVDASHLYGSYKQNTSSFKKIYMAVLPTISHVVTAVQFLLTLSEMKADDMKIH